MNNTCGKCIHLRFGDMCGLRTAYCGMTEGDDFIVPHNSKLENGRRGDHTVITLTRIPKFCLRDDVKKSDVSAPVEDWVTITVDAHS